MCMGSLTFIFGFESGELRRHYDSSGKEIISLTSPFLWYPNQKIFWINRCIQLVMEQTIFILTAPYARE
jgi:hypothetical protein